VSEATILPSATGAKVAVRHCTGSGHNEIVIIVIQCQGFGVVIEVILDMDQLKLQDPFVGNIGNLGTHDNVYDGVLIVTINGVKLIGLDEICFKVRGGVGVNVINPGGVNLVFSDESVGLCVVKDARQKPFLGTVNKEFLGKVESHVRNSRGHGGRT
jgi:hypothetical protein